MNVSKNYDLEHFDDYNNFYTILQKTVRVFERVQDDENVKPQFVLKGERTKFEPIWGHFYNDENHFIYQKVYRKKVQNMYRNLKHYMCNLRDLAKPLHSNFYKFENLEECDLTIEELQNNVITNKS